MPPKQKNHSRNGERVTTSRGKGTLVEQHGAAASVLLDDGPKQTVVVEQYEKAGPRRRPSDACDRCGTVGHHAFDCPEVST